MDFVNDLFLKENNIIKILKIICLTFTSLNIIKQRNRIYVNRIKILR